MIEVEFAGNDALRSGRSVGLKTLIVIVLAIGADIGLAGRVINNAREAANASQCFV